MKLEEIHQILAIKLPLQAESRGGGGGGGGGGD